MRDIVKIKTLAKGEACRVACSAGKEAILPQEKDRSKCLVSLRQAKGRWDREVPEPLDIT